MQTNMLKSASINFSLLSRPIHSIFFFAFILPHELTLPHSPLPEEPSNLERIRLSIQGREEGICGGF